MVPFRPVNGPLEPLPAPQLKSYEEARRIALAALLARAPRPAFKPADRPEVVPAGFEAAPLPRLKPERLLAHAERAADGPLPEPRPDHRPPLAEPAAGPRPELKPDAGQTCATGSTASCG
jgi:hypothetical protein